MNAIKINAFVKDLAHLQVSKNIPLPQPKKSSDIHIRITHAGVTHVDQLYAQGLHQNNRRHVQPPFILGNEFAGVVTAAPEASQFEPGDRVFGGGLGSYAEHICVDESQLRKIPDHWSNADACGVGSSGAVSYGALVSVAGLKAGESVLILGASGGLGVMAIQIACAVGAKPIALVGSKEKERMVGRLGAKWVNYREPDWEGRVKALTSDRQGVEVVYDAIGSVESGLKCLKYRGRLVIVGFAAREGVMEKVQANRILLKSAMVHGYRYGEDGRQDPQRTVEVWDGFMALVEKGSIKPVVYEQEYKGLGAIPQALDDVKRHKTWGRVVASIDEGDETQKARL